MKFAVAFAIIFTLMLSACSPSQRIVNSWISPEAASKGPYESIFVIVLAQNTASSFSVEDRMADLIRSRGQKAVVSSSVFPPNTSISENFTREQMAEAIKRTGCDAVFVTALLDVRVEEYYQPGSTYYPMSYGMYGSYYGYYNHYYSS